MTVLKLPIKKKLNRLVNWHMVTKIDRIEGGIMIYFLDGTKIKDNRTIEQAEKIAIKYWGVK